MNKKMFIFVQTQFEGFHCYPNAPEEVSFLRNEHRHIFKTKIYLETFHEDREVEFFIFQRFINSILKENKLNNLSCEMISDNIYNEIIKRFPNREIKIEVSEDGENGSFIEYKLEEK